LKVLDKRNRTYEQIDEIPEHSIILNGKEVEITASGKLHSRWVGKIYKRLDNLYDRDYWLFTNEISILISKNPLLVLSSDIALVSRKKLKNIDTKILEITPDLVIEIEKEREEAEIKEKINYYSSIGINKQIWVLLSKREVLVIDSDKRAVYSEVIRMREKVIPDLVVEVVSDSSERRDKIIKKRLYDKKKISVYVMDKNKYINYSAAKVKGGVKSKVLECFKIDLKEVFK